MISRKSWVSGLGLTLLVILPLSLSNKLLADQPEWPPVWGLLQSEATLSTAAEGTQTQSASAQAPASAQEPGKPADHSGASRPPAVSAPKHQEDDKRQENDKHQENDRIFFALPNYLTVEHSASLPPMTTRQKFKTVAEGCFDPVEVVFMGVEAGIGQADNTNPTYGQGFIGYSKRFGTAYADAIIGNFGTGAIFPALLNQDPRYYQLGKGNPLHRMMYAAGRVLVTRSERSRKLEFNFSEFLGNGLAAGVANAYHPGPHTLASNADVLGTQVLLDITGYELKEFWPDLRRLLVRVHH